MSEFRLTGGCQCGAVRYALHEPPTGPHICHCRMCQKAFGSFFAPLTGVPLQAFELTRGKLGDLQELRPDRARLLPRLRHAAHVPLCRPRADRRLDRLARRAGEGEADDAIRHRSRGCPGSASLPAFPATRRPSRMRRNSPEKSQRRTISIPTTTPWTGSPRPGHDQRAPLSLRHHAACPSARRRTAPRTDKGNKCRHGP